MNSVTARRWLLMLAFASAVMVVIFADASAAPVAVQAAPPTPTPPSFKQATVDRLAADQAHQQQVAAQPVPSLGPRVARPTTDLATQFREGIFSTDQAPLPPRTYAIDTVFQGIREGIVIQVYAGSLRTDPEQGFLYVNIVNPNAVTSSHRSRAYLVPARTGSVHLESIQGDVLSFSTAKGSRGTFNILNRTLTSS